MMPARRRGTGGESPKSVQYSESRSKQRASTPFSWSMYLAVSAAVLIVAGLYMLLSRVQQTAEHTDSAPGVPRRRFVDLADEPSPRRGLVGDANAGFGDQGSGPVADAGKLPPAEPKPSPFVSDGMKRTIVLGSGGGLWNTGVWTGWGYGTDVTLNWAAAGVAVHKTCDYRCDFVRDEDALSYAHAWVAETVNHEKFLGQPKARQVPVPMPPMRRAPYAQSYSTGQAVPPNRQVVEDHLGQALVPKGKQSLLPARIQFYYDNAQGREEWTSSPALRSQFDFTMTPEPSSDLPVSLICPWGHDEADFLSPPPQKLPGRFMAYFSEHGPSAQDRSFVEKLVQLMPTAGDVSMHSYINWRNTNIPAEAGGDPFQLAQRIQFMGTYKFLFITEDVLETGFINPEWSQAFLAGTVPVYLGAPHIEDYAPDGLDSFVNARDFVSPEELVQFLRAVAEDDAAYDMYFDWKAKHAGRLPQRFSFHLNNCAHYAECRLCELVHHHT